MAGSAVPPTRLPRATRVAVREVLLAELVSAETRARAAGCPPEVLFEELDARLRTAVEESRDAGSRPAAGDPGDVVGPACAHPRSAAHGRDAGPRPPAGCRELADAVGPARYGQPRWAPEDAVSSSRPPRHPNPGSAAEDSQDRRHDPVEPGLVGESRG
ncbi:hypothetical protein Amsp01_053010 [Amycolatopsis sp. NBRC 101858]|nr:hypothetical protein Amsp01_053010 [Amycolatopsis sp. NBRC 101858]